MKLKTAAISLFVTAGICGGAGYGAWYYMQTQKTPVEVVAVANVNSNFWGEENETIYGSVTSQVAQTVVLNDEYNVSEIYVDVGDAVKEGDPLFAYDMTMQELELEMEQLSLQTQELTLTRLEKDLEKYKKGKINPSLDDNDYVYTMAADSDEDVIIDDSTERDPSDSDNPEDGGGTGGGSDGGGSPAGGDGGIIIEDMEPVGGGGGDNEKPSEQELILKGIDVFETSINEITILLESHKDNIKSSDIAGVMEEAANYYYSNIVDAKSEEYQDDSGQTGTRTVYVIKKSIRDLLDETNLDILKQYIEKFKEYKSFYNDLKKKEESSESTTENNPSTESESSSQTDSEGGSESDTEKGSEGGSEKHTEKDSEKSTECSSEPTTEKGSEKDTEHVSESTPDIPSQTDTESEPTPQTESVPDEKKEYYISSFLQFFSALTSEGASSEKDYFEKIENAISYYQVWLAVPTGSGEDGMMDGTENPGMSGYQLRDDIAEYLKIQNSVTPQQLEEAYKTICKSYVNELIKKLKADKLVTSDILKATEGYNRLGDAWQAEIEKEWNFSHVSVQDGTETTVVDTVADTLKAYKVMALFQEYKNLDDLADVNERYTMLQSIMDSFNALTDTQKSIVLSDPTFESTMREYNLWETGQESESDFNPDFPTDSDDFDDFDDYDDYGDYDDGYTSEELKELIEEKEREIKDCKLGIREMKITVDQKQRVVDGKIVKANMDGTVISMGTIDGESDYDYFARVANESGLYAKGIMSELALEKINIGDSIAGMMTDSGISFTATIKEISPYPDKSGSYFGYSSGNSNASYYPFYALLDNTMGIEEGEAEIQLSGSYSSGSNIFLEKYFVRTGNDGKPYVFIQAPDGTLKKQHVTTGKTVYSYAIEILSGITIEDRIAFPYGKNVFEGAQTVEVDMLENI